MTFNILQQLTTIHLYIYDSRLSIAPDGRGGWLKKGVQIEKVPCLISCYLSWLKAKLFIQVRSSVACSFLVKAQHDPYIFTLVVTP
ncbi:MAG: hypothetical protein A2X47_13785 [Lentisphaerae bacterium GWF2_38_69]|nr:MAG: hypothetical protein A2X47_13785 [Lentisphaerae bacterium GWF2_38_69]